MTKFPKFITLCGALFLLICCMMLYGCRKTQQQDGVSNVGGANNTSQAGVDSGEETLDDDVNLEIETHGTVKTSDSTAKSTKQSTDKSTGSTKKSAKQATQKSTDGTVKSTKQSTDKSTGSAEKNTVQNADSTLESTKQSSGNSTDGTAESTKQSTDTSTDKTTVTTVPTTQEGWTPELGKRPKS